MSTKSRDILKKEREMVTLSSLVDQFIATKLTEGKARKTTDWYRWILLQYVNYVGSKATLKDLTIVRVREFVAQLQARDTRYDDHPVSPKKAGGLSAYTIHGYVRTLKVFSSWLEEEDLTPVDLLSKLKRPKLPQVLVEVLTPDEQQRLIDSINQNTFLGARTYAIVLLMLDTGIRADELLTLTIDNTKLEQGTIKVHGKGDKERIVPIGNGAKKAVGRYLMTWRPPSSSPFVFTSIEGELLSYTALAHLLKRVGEKAEVPRLRAHLLRHTFAVNYLVGGGDLITLKMILGHVDVSTTQKYLHLAARHIQDAHARYSPVDNLIKEKKRRR